MTPKQQRCFFVLGRTPLLLLLLLVVHSSSSSPHQKVTTEDEEELEHQDRSTLAQQRKHATSPKNEFLSTQEDCQNNNDSEKTCQATPVYHRSVYPAEQPLVCLAFLSCCGRTDLLQSTLNAAVRHMEEDEPSVVGRHYEIAWVDNGSPKEKQDLIKDSFKIDHALAMPRNMGLAWGMNALLFDLCTAPYIVLMEEDWLYMDEKVAQQTEQRRHAIARAIALLETKPVDPVSQRPIQGVFLRTESNIVPTTKGVVPHTTLKSPGGSMEQPYLVQDMEYRISCMNFQQTGHLFGAFSNGASLYHRHALTETIGRMYGEPHDVFSDLAVEPNYSFRVGLQFCAARLPMDPHIPQCDYDNDNASNQQQQQQHVPATCAAAFAHIGGGRGTRPARRKHMKCVDDAWNFYGTPYFDQYPKQECSKHLPNIWEQLKLNEEFQRINDQYNLEVFRKEQEQRKLMLEMADIFEPRCHNPSDFRQYYGQHDPTYKKMTDEEIRNFPTKLRNMATSEHQLPGFWDILGRPIGVDFDIPYVQQDKEEEEESAAV